MRAGVRGVFGRHAVGVFSGIEAAALAGHLAANVQERVLRHLGVERIAGDLCGLEVRERQLRLVVQHLLEVRHAPVRID